jgi:hypothetical protein
MVRTTAAGLFSSSLPLSLSPMERLRWSRWCCHGKLAGDVSSAGEGGSGVFTPGSGVCILPGHLPLLRRRQCPPPPLRLRPAMSPGSSPAAHPAPVTADPASPRLDPASPSTPSDVTKGVETAVRGSGGDGQTVVRPAASGTPLVPGNGVRDGGRQRAAVELTGGGRGWEPRAVQRACCLAAGKPAVGQRARYLLRFRFAGSRQQHGACSLATDLPTAGLHARGCRCAPPTITGESV